MSNPERRRLSDKIYSHTFYINHSSDNSIPPEPETGSASRPQVLEFPLLLHRYVRPRYYEAEVKHHGVSDLQVGKIKRSPAT